MHAETSRAGAAREARLRSTTETATIPTPTTTTTSAYASPSSSAQHSPRTPRKAKARSITYGDRFIPSRDGSDMQAAYQLMTDDLNAPSRSKRKLTADMDAQKEEANQAFSSLLTTELFGLPTPPKANHARTHSANASINPSAIASASASPLPSGSASRPNPPHHHRHHSANANGTAAGGGPSGASTGAATGFVSTAGVGMYASPGAGGAGAGDRAGSRASTPQQAGSGTASSSDSATAGTGTGAQSGTTAHTGQPLPAPAPPSSLPTATSTASALGMGPSSGLMSMSMGMGMGGSGGGGGNMHATNFSGAPTPTTPTKRNLLSYRSPSLPRSGPRIKGSSSSSAATGSGAGGLRSSASSPGPGDWSAGAGSGSAAGAGGGMRGTRSSQPGTPRTPSSLARGAPDDDTDMTLLMSGGSSSSLGAGTVSNENIGLARGGSGGGLRLGGGLFGNHGSGSSSGGGGGGGAGGNENSGGGGGGGSAAAGLGMMDVTIDSPTHKAYSLSPVKLESQRMLLSPRRTPRTMSKVPYKVLDAPELADDFYLNLVDWSPSNVLGVGLGHCVYLWSAKTAQVSKLVDLSASKDRVTGLNWAGRGPHIAVGTDAGLVQIWDAERMKLIRTHRGHTGRVGALAWNEHILSSGSRDRMIFHHDVRVKDQYVAALAGHRQEVCGLKWSPESNQLASGGNDNKLMIWDGLHTTPLHRFTRHEAAIKALAWSPHQHGLLASGGGTADMKIRFWNTLTGQMLQEVDTGSQVCNLMWSKTANEVVSTHGYSAGKVQNQIQVWRYPAMAPLATLTGHTMRVLYLAMSPDGETIVTGAGDETLRFWDLNTPSKSQLEKRNESAAFNAFAKIR
ncbi:unnamed protein product [Tilletia laevis]|uniref:CDC20/Fizzy WD40 domain-containing protein n=2 Tax=Tilletia TaxID=13289 RepID=A0A177U019_9BASI|nr:hypothetical protein CF336_g4102 [Tilletia laevis]KAE8251857.1 hypothetical protein A4X03_0g6298 [Tilletia caries]CAD6884279.1 unnamed protein product [Tilletia caries]CAD6907628.1 unnamed protein product [Tilletia caries]CAD6961789.1 unnamed protein product [Tilletia caries]